MIIFFTSVISRLDLWTICDEICCVHSNFHSPEGLYFFTSATDIVHFFFFLFFCKSVFRFSLPLYCTMYIIKRYISNSIQWMVPLWSVFFKSPNVAYVLENKNLHCVAQCAYLISPISFKCNIFRCSSYDLMHFSMDDDDGSTQPQVLFFFVMTKRFFAIVL